MMNMIQIESKNIQENDLDLGAGWPPISTWISKRAKKESLQEKFMHQRRHILIR
jgi:hypothetical protein